jgi:mRNA interferase MazF
VVVKRGELWWADLPAPSGSELGYKHPVLIIQSNAFNSSNIATIIAVLITSNTRLALAPGNVFLPKKQSKLRKDSVANVSQILTLDKTFLQERIGLLNQHLLSQVETGIKVVLALDRRYE